ncbi:MAG: LysM peptidoglycan-binding domain-containing protein [Desulfobacteraceae bacterium]|nr:LysM peptidoglycan-binding domain-containing protein [Desulfobacteraceae bacterium]MBC2758190.1 LysM peptidoglycan-binding domain-containing protein [Desulfobacteraceae bacterium]
MTPYPPDDNNSCEPVSPADDGSYNIAYLPLIPLGDESCDTGNTTSGNGSVSTVIQAKLDEALDFYQVSQDFWQQGELDNALQALDQAYALITEVDAFDQPKLIQQKDDLRFMISKRILEIYTSRHITAKGNHNAIPLVMNTHVQKEIDLFTKSTCRSFFEGSYKRSGRYRRYIVNELRKAGLPEELSWLPLIESGFKVNALSSARALGLWQFISSTGHKFGLKRNLYIDERLDPYKSTHAAIEYLKELHEIFGDWPTVLAAYNCGEGRVLRTIRNQNVSYLDDFWDLYQRLPRETARYVPKFMATLHIINNPEHYGIKDIVLDDPVQFDIQRIAKQAYLKDIAETIHLQEIDLVNLNPELRYKLLPPEEYPLKIPIGMKETLIANIDEILEYAQTHPGLAYHRVRPGETLSTIARRYNTSVNTIARYNNIYRKNYIAAGKILKIPQPGKTSSSKQLKIITYYVRRGDSLWTLAKRYDTTTKKIQEFNQLKTVTLNIGQILKIPTGPHHGLALYKVKSGDSPSKIANKHNMNLSQLLRLNNLTKNSTIYPGQQLYVE